MDPTMFGSNLSITVEINPPHSGINRRVSGVYAYDEATPDLFVLHRGRIGGGRSGIGAGAFWQIWDRGLTLEASEGGRMTRFALVGRVDDPDFPHQVARFVHRVSSIKATALST
jgi:hypothetical protein